MKYIITILAALAIGAGSAWAGCNKKVSSIGKLKSWDAESKMITLVVQQSSSAKQLEAKSAELTMTPDSTIVHAGQVDSVNIADVVGKNISVVSEHGKIDYVITLADKS